MAQNAQKEEFTPQIDAKKTVTMPNRGSTPNQKTGGKPNHANQNSNPFNRTPNNRNNEQRQFTPRNNGQGRNHVNKGNQQSSTLKNFNDGKPVEFEPDPEKEEGSQESTGQSRLFVGGLPEAITQEQVRQMFQKFGEVKEVYIPQGKTFAFIKMTNRMQADQAKYGLSGKTIAGQNRPIRVKFAAQGTSVEVKNLSPLISNERLYDAFSRFGKIERAVVMVDERGKSLEKGIVEFDRKNSATKAIEQVNQGCFFLTMSPRAVVCAAVDSVDDADGLQEECLYNTYGFEEEYSFPPRFAAQETFEMDFGNRWKALEELERSQIEIVKIESAERKKRLEQEMHVGMGEEQERLIRREMEQQQARLRQMEETRRQRQEDLRARHEQEIESAKRQRLSLNESHLQLKHLVEGSGMRDPESYRPPPTFRADDQLDSISTFGNQNQSFDEDSRSMASHNGWPSPAQRGSRGGRGRGGPFSPSGRGGGAPRGGFSGSQNFDPIKVPESCNAMTQKIKELEEKHLLNDDGFEQTVNQLRQDQHGNGGPPQRGGRGGGNFRGGGRGGFGDSRGRGRGGRGGAGRGRGGRSGPY